jgi:hypothetical protein
VATSLSANEAGHKLAMSRSSFHGLGASTCTNTSGVNHDANVFLWAFVQDRKQSDQNRHEPANLSHAVLPKEVPARMSARSADWSFW